MMIIDNVISAFQTGDRQTIEMMARNILQTLEHESISELSFSHKVFRKHLTETNQSDMEYLSLVYILAEYIEEIKEGRCTCSIVEKKMYNSPERLKGIFNSEVIDPKPYFEDYSCICRTCGSKYLAQIRPKGHGETVIWNKIT